MPDTSAGSPDNRKSKRQLAEAILNHCSVSGMPHLYVLGSYEGRVTIHSQQIRALNLVYALEILGRLKKEKDGELQVAVIGGGIGGMTAAVAAARLQVAVTIFERHSELLHNLRGCHTRHLHPNIYDWPQQNASERETKLPFLNWEAGSADAVAAKLLEQWNTELGTPERAITVHAPVQVALRSSLLEGRRHVTVTSHPHQELKFDLVILAVGFGIEKSMPPQPLRSYWRNDSLHQPEIEIRPDRTRYLVSGNGDGGLIDVLRLRLKDFKQENLIQDFKLDTLDQREALLQIEDSLASVSAPDRSIYEQYSQLKKPEELDRLLISRLRSDTAVTFNYATWPFSCRSSVLHRYLVYRLLQIDEHTTVQPGFLKALEGHEPSLTAKIDLDGDVRLLPFHRAVVRHGPNSAIARDFPLLNQEFRLTLDARNVFDETRRRLWPDGFFDDRQMASVESVSAQEETNKPADIGEIEVEESPSSDEAVIGTLRPGSLFGIGLHATDKNALQLRDELRNGESQDLINKLALLTAIEKAWLLHSVLDAALVDDRALIGLRHLLHETDIAGSAISVRITRLVRDAVFKGSIARKESILRLGPSILKLVDADVLQAFFGSIIKLVERDQYSEVNVIMPALGDVQGVIPPSLYSSYIDALLGQALSNAARGAPAARLAILRLPDGILNALLEKLSEEWLAQQPNTTRILLGKVLQRYSATAPSDKQAMIDKYVSRALGTP